MRLSRMPLVVVIALACTGALTAGCTGGGLSPDDDDDDDDGGEGEGDSDTGFPLPASDLTEAIGSAGTLEIAAWNLKNFPCGNPSFSTECVGNPAGKPALLADAITSMALDIVAVEEIADEDAFNEVVQRLPHHESLLSSDTYGDGTYQKIGFIYDAGVVEAGGEALLFQSDANFPRPAFQVPFTHIESGTTFLAVAVHLKAGETTEDFNRRAGAIARMESYARNLVDGAGEDNIIMLGDFNEVLTGAGLASWQPFRDAERYVIRTQPNAFAGEETFLPSGVILDHIVTTTGLASIAGTDAAVIPRLDVDVSGYRDQLSDHLPVVLKMTP